MSDPPRTREGGPPRPPRPPRPITAAYLERSALHYLERYAASAAMLRWVLLRRVEKRCRLRGEDPAPFAPLVEETVARAAGAGYVNDEAFARARVARLRRRGTSARLIAGKLAAKGISREAIGAALAGGEADEGVDEGGPVRETVNPELEAARALVRRRRLGPYRPAPQRAERRARDLAVLARSGFAYDVARRALEADPEEALEEATDPDAALPDEAGDA